MEEINNTIKKSLIDKSIDSLVYNPSIVKNGHTKSIKDQIKHLLSDADRIDIAVSYIVWSGLSLIYNDLKKFDSNSRILLTSEGFVSDPRSLQKLLNLNVQVKVYNPKSKDIGFHLKTYLFESKNNRSLMIGSSNISSRAFGLVHEMAVVIEANKNGYIIEEYGNTFEELWNHELSEQLTQDFINRYTQAYSMKHEFDNKVNSVMLDEDMIQPNYMQLRALEELSECRNNSDRGLVIAATGTGKTYLSAFDIRNSDAKNVLFLVHNRLIITEAKKTYERVFKNKKILELSSSNIHELGSSDIVFTTDKTAYSYLLNNVRSDYFDYIVYDEAHKIGEETKYSELISFFTPKFTLGITATPERTDKPDYLFRVFKYHIPYEIRLLEAMNNELVCPFTYYGFDLDTKLLKENEEFDYVELAKYLKNIIKEKGYYGLKLKSLVFCADIKEARSISDQLNEVGIKSIAAVSGTDSLNQSVVENYIQELRSDITGTLQAICTVNKFNEGIDIPDINTIIMLRNTQSSIIYTQQLGRGLRRTYDPHKFVTVIDIIGNSNNNYSIAQVLTGNETADKRALYRHTNESFNKVSPFINVEIEKKAVDKIIKSISNNFTVKTQVKGKLNSELHRYKEIPTLLEMYLNPNFKELELLQLLYKNFYSPFEKHYNQKFQIDLNNKFVNSFFTLISQFVFRAYNKSTLRDYVRLLSGEAIKNDLLSRVLLPKLFTDGISSAINSDYNKGMNNYPDVFIYDLNKNEVYLNSDIVVLLKKENAFALFMEHIELFSYISLHKSYKMDVFSLVDKGEFLFNVGSADCYMNVVGERIDRTKKAVYCTIKITEKESHYDNYIIDNNKVVYYTQSSNTKEKAQEKIFSFVDEKYKFYICAQFPHLGYTNTTYFNLGNLEIVKISEVKSTSNGKYNHEIVFRLEKDLPIELLQYKSIDR